ncbi:glycosyltransferase family 2 protein [Paraburkholderia denitrificans]|uniref:Glycosyltransferase family 2 protein n=1 Tax=Paraburkholderia denitrificans TaxID=694025 RepID=A0ABW0JB13_9BURK
MDVNSLDPRTSSEPKRVAIGVVLYENSPAEIHRCLDAIARQDGPEQIAEVLFRDQSGNCLPHVHAWTDTHQPRFEVRTWTGENRGFGAGHNALFREMSSGSDAYLCLNPDGTLHPSCVKSLMSFAEMHSWNGIFEALQEPIMHPKHFDPQSGLTAWCSGACVLIPKSVYEAIDGFDDSFFLYCEDVDLSWRVKALGMHCYTVAGALFFHYAVERSGRSPEMWKSAYLLARKWRAGQFKQVALKNLTDMLDANAPALNELRGHVTEMPMEAVFRARPDFEHNLVFATPIWS